MVFFSVMQQYLRVVVISEIVSSPKLQLLFFPGILKKESARASQTGIVFFGCPRMQFLSFLVIAVSSSCLFPPYNNGDTITSACFFCKIFQERRCFETSDYNLTKFCMNNSMLMKSFQFSFQSGFCSVTGAAHILKKMIDKSRQTALSNYVK